MTSRIQSLGEQMSERRKELGLSQSAAARAAGISRTAWVAWENDAARPEDYNYVKIERALRWTPGSVEAAFEGRLAMREEQEDDRPPFDLVDTTEQEIWRIPELTPEQRVGVIMRRRERIRRTGQ